MYINWRKIVHCYKKVGISLTLLVISHSWAVATPKEAHPDKYAAIVIDANTGKTLFQANAALKRYPASLTKMMTVYMIFEAIKNGRVTPNTPIPISNYAATRPPTKIGIKAGQTISIEAATKALITKSANDVAAAIGEYLGGSEQKFAQMMTIKARKLGMKNTRFANASGLPDTRNYSTAQDIATLALALRKHFPEQYKLFKTTHFTFRGQTINNHNTLIKTIKGVDGIKTGYTQMSGSNLATSMRIDGRSIVAVVMGGKSSTTRNIHMANLLKQYLPKTSRIETNKNLVATVHYKLPTVSATPIPIIKDNLINSDDEISSLLTALAEQSNDPNTAVAAVNQVIIPIPNPHKTKTVKINKVISASLSSNSGWAVQIGSLPSEKQAKLMLAKATNAAHSTLQHASPHMQPFKKDGRHYYRARFIGFPSKKAALNTCTALRKANFNCYTVAY
ncbi:D-alanyl-D-alanine carboxypeptidase [Bartonella sp. AR 15-3]|uniref:D-alanyl-D-alanine carboxypeptidase n=1 Tax=Bartonella sp. AR 15-3 TaxID=545617 RepID=UPI0001F4C3C1|nr:D-alanyl-D-alanine carboxypeptidase [Bartonella sp. AR 15-3]OPB31499.1 penicillin-binding protein 6, Serine peptidase, MEROPS family S11 [Bartonella sp. AR 15-3]CBI79481.1 Penicillin-binding protein [Bartonella sp. AR 15-3]